MNWFDLFLWAAVFFLVWANFSDFKHGVKMRGLLRDDIARLDAQLWDTKVQLRILGDVLKDQRKHENN